MSGELINKSCRSLTLLIFLITSTLTFTVSPAQTSLTLAQTTTPASTVAKATILLGQDYFYAARLAIQQAQESIYVAMYLINVQPAIHQLIRQFS